ncbi:coproporphyrinogen III oxidase family protein [Desulfurobacterium sp.]
MNIINSALVPAMRYKLLRTLKFRKAVGEPPAEDMNSREKKLLYIHVPYCEEVCPFCCFNSYDINKYRHTIKEYFEAVKEEIKMYRDLGYDFNSAYVGGGTPTTVPDELAEILEFIRKEFNITEISIEANPRISDETVKIFQNAGLDRLSIGIQSFNNQLLKEIGRYEKYGSGEEIKERVKEIIGKFRIVNLDFIFNLPTQTPEILKSDLETAIELGADQITCYPLMVAEQNVKNIKQMGQVDYNKERYMYFNTVLPAMKEKYIPASSWCFSRKREDKKIDMIDEYIVDYQDYIGVGCGSFSFANGYVNMNAYTIPLYISLIKEGKFPTIMRSYKLAFKDHMRYYMMMSLFGRRLNKEKFKERFGVEYERALWWESKFVKLMGMVTEERGNVYTTERGMYAFLIMLRQFFVYANRLRFIGKKGSAEIEAELRKLIKESDKAYSISG